MLIEPRPYGPEIAPAELAELRERVWRVEDRLFMFKEVPVQTTFTLNLLFDRLEELAQGLERFAYIVDLRGVKRPDAEVRETLRRRVGRLNPRLAHVGVVVGSSDLIIRAVAKLVGFALGFRSFTTHATVDEAVEACRRALR